MPTHDREELLELRRQHHQLSEERRPLLQVRDHLDPVVAFTFVEQEKANHAVALLCRVLGVSPSGYWAWRTRPTSKHDRADHELLARIIAIHAASGGAYGAPRVHAALVAEGIHCGRKRVARLMRAHGLASSSISGSRRTS